MSNSIDLTGRRFGRLVVEEKAGTDKRGSIRWTCQCDCGGTSVVTTAALQGGHTKSCGCFRAEKSRDRMMVHGGSKTRLHSIWKQMRIRCRCATNPTYKYYGGRGISICEEWDDFSNFREWALANGYADDLSIDRIDVNGDYCPANCRWISKAAQSRNTRNCKRYIYDGKDMTHNEWARFLEIDPATLTGRIKRHGIEKALSMKKKT